ncbi:TspO/MBR family protein [Lederbergia lenta]|nr:TspO/MBR family protein [Lederbergia lenta]MCM3109830.1 tryptophan-rich sensory protein [Lederbergia lenta]
MMTNKNKWKMIRSIAVPLIGGTIAGVLATRSAKAKYQHLERPKFAPPSWVFPVAWTSLYTTMGIAKYQFDQKSQKGSLQTYGDITYSTQLGLNYLWSFLFFRWNLRGTALVDAMLLWTSVNLNTYYFYRKSKLAGTLMLPYAAWVSYAVALNYATWEMNREKHSEKRELV